MREQLNSNPLVQLAVVGVLMLGAAVFFLSSGGGESEEGGAPETTVDVIAPEPGGPAAGAATAPVSLDAVLAQLNTAVVETPPLPKRLVEAYEAGKTPVLLFVQHGGIDDRLVRSTTKALEGFRDTEVFIVPAARISRYAAVTEGAGVERVPALVVISPKGVSKSVPVASVQYGYQSPASVSQAVIDAGYKGKTLDYHP